MFRILSVAVLTFWVPGLVFCADNREPVAPKEVIPLFNGKDLSGLTTWLKDTKREDPRKVFRIAVNRNVVAPRLVGKACCLGLDIVQQTLQQIDLVLPVHRR